MFMFSCFQRPLDYLGNHFGCVMFSVLAPNVIDPGFECQLVQTKDERL